MSDVNANISVNIDTSAALGELKNLQRQISQFHNQIAKSSASAAIAQRNLQQEFVNSINSTGQFAARMQTIRTSAESFTNSLEKNKFSMREYFRYGVASSKNFGKVFKTEFATINKVAEERVRQLQTQYIKMGRDANGAMKAIAVTPLAIDMENLGTKTMMAAQKQQLFNQLLAQGTTNLINFGKNTQWAGRQLMVGFTIPLSIFGSTASKVFMDLEKQVIRFKRVYGDMLTPTEETQANLTVIRGLAEEFTKYGVAIADTMSIAADAAAAGFSGEKLTDQVKAATRLSVLGEVDKQQALSATIAIQTAFKMNSDQLADSINFLNAVENQSVVSLQNLTDAIPKVAPVIQGLGGDIKDMSVFLAAMQEGGVQAAQAANGLKSALASMINPSKAAREMLAGVNIDLGAIVSRNEGNIMRTVLDLADAMKQLTPLARQRILEKLFGKFQFARVSALFDNIATSGSQAANAMELVKMSSQDLAAIANRELNAIEENTATKFRSATESLRSAIAPVGEAFLKVVTPIIEFFTKIADKFNNLSDGAKKVVTVLITLFAGVGPIVLMLVGLIANFGGQLLKMFGLIRNGYLKLTGQSQYLGDQTQYLTTEQMQAEAVAHSLDQVHARLTQRFTVEADAVNNLRNAYLSAAAASRAFAFNNPGMMVPQSKQPKKYAEGGIISGPGSGTSDSIFARVSNGEAIIPAASVARNPDIVTALISNNIPGFATGKNPTTGTVLGGTFKSRRYSPVAMMAPGNTPGGFGMDQEWLTSSEEAKASFAAAIKTAMMMEQEIKVTQANYKKFGEGLTPVLDNIFSIFKEGVTSDVTNIAQVGQSQYPLIIESIEQMAANGQIAAADMQSMSVAIRKLLNPLESDLTQQNLQRVELAINDAGQNVVKRASTERFGTSYKDQIRRSFASELAMRGQPQPADYPGSYQFAHIPYSQPTQTYVEPFLRKKAGAGSAIEQQVLQQLREGAIFKEGQILVEQNAMQLGRATVNAVAKGAGTASPSDFTYETGKDIDNGLILGMEKNSGQVRAAAERVANGAVTQFEQTASGLLVPSGTGSRSGTGQASQPEFLGMPTVPKKQSLRSRMNERMANSKFTAGASKISSGAMKYGMVASGVAMGSAMLPGQVGQFAQSLMPAVMGLQTFAMMLPMLTNPIGLAVAGIAGLTAGFLLLRKAQNDYIEGIKKAAKQEAEIRQGSAESLRSFGAFIGEGGLPSERQFNRVGNQKFISADNAKLAKFRDFYGEQGAADAEVLRASQSKGMESAITATVNDIANRIAVNALDPQDIAANIKAATEQSGANELEVRARLEKLFSPDGSDILKTPITLKARMEFLDSGTKTITETVDEMSFKIQNIKPPTVWDKFVKGFMTTLTGQRVGDVVADVSNKVQAYTVNQENMANITNLLNLNFEKQRQSLALLNAAYVDGTISEEEYNAQHATTMANFAALAKSSQNYIDQLNKIDSSGELAKTALEDLADNLLAPFEKTNKKVAKQIKGILSAMPSKVQTEILMNYARGSLTETDILQMDLMLQKLNGKTYEQKLAFVAEIPSSEKGLIALMKLRIEYERLTVLQLEKINQDSINRINRARGGKALNLGASVAYNAQLEKIRELKKELDALNKVTKDSPTVEGTTGVEDGGGSKDNPYDFIDGLLKRLKEVRKDSINAAGGTAAFKKALEGNLTGFKGTEELLRLGGATEGFIDIIKGLDTKTLNTINKGGDLFKFGKDGKVIFGELGDAVNKFATEIELGDFVTQQQKIKVNADQQVIAYNNLTKAGVSASKILEVLGNEGLTAAVALEKVGSTDFNEFIKNLKTTDATAKELAKTLKILSFMNEEEQETATDKMNDYFAAQEAIIKQQARVDFTKLRGYSPEQYDQLIDKQEELIDGIQREIELEQEKIDNIQEELDLYGRGLDLISRQEDKIKDSYDKRIDSIDDQISALEEVKKINEDIVSQQKQQTDLAGALSSGDLGAAAKIAQEMRASAAANSQDTFIANLESKKSSLELQRQKDIDSIQVDINNKKYTRAELNDLIIQKEDAIYLLEQSTLKTLNDRLDVQSEILTDMQYIVDKYNKDMTNAINNVTNATGQTKAEWESVNAVIETTADWLGDAHLLGLTDDIAEGTLAIEAAWIRVLAAIEAANAAAAAGAAGSGGSGGGGANAKQTQTPTPLSKEQQKIATTQISEVQSLVKSGDIAKAESATVAMMKQIAAVKPIAAQDVVAMRKAALGYLSTGGLVPKYFAAGGFARGSDTVPAMLTPGEFVMSKYAVNQHGVGKMKAINSGEEVGGSVYTYNLSVNVKSDASPNDIARTVMAQIKQIDAQRVRGVRQ